MKRSKQKNVESFLKRIFNYIYSLFIIQFFVFIFKQYILRLYRYVFCEDDEHFVNDHHPKPSKFNSGLCGLSNLGNTCYMNSALQCLSNTVPLRDYFISHDFRKDINKKNPMGMKGNIAECFGELLRQMWKSKKSYISPKAFKNIISKWGSQFEGNDQHDSQELLAFLLDGLHEDLNRVSKKPYGEINFSNDSSDYEIANESWRIHTLRNKSIIVDIFHGLLKSTIMCNECGFTSKTFDPFAYLSIPVVQLEKKSKKKTVELSDCLSLFSTNEILGKNDLWYCSKCKLPRRVHKKLEIWKVPNILIIHLKRFSFNRRSRNKLTSLVNFPIDNLNLDEFIINPEEKGFTYNLFAISNHSGTLRGGHYTTYAKNSYNNNWYSFNDSRVKQIKNIDDIVSNTAYMLFYQKVKL